MPNAADRTAGRCSVTIRNPPAEPCGSRPRHRRLAGGRSLLAAPALAVAGPVAVPVPAVPAAVAVPVAVTVMVVVAVAGAAVAARRLALYDLHRDQGQLAAV